jgi:hypothetical protein
MQDAIFRISRKVAKPPPPPLVGGVKGRGDSANQKRLAEKAKEEYRRALLPTSCIEDPLPIPLRSEVGWAWMQT